MSMLLGIVTNKESSCCAHGVDVTVLVHYSSVFRKGETEKSGHRLVESLCKPCLIKDLYPESTKNSPKVSNKEMNDSM